MTTRIDLCEQDRNPKQSLLVLPWWLPPNLHGAPPFPFRGPALLVLLVDLLVVGTSPPTKSCYSLQSVPMPMVLQKESMARIWFSLLSRVETSVVGVAAVVLGLAMGLLLVPPLALLIAGATTTKRTTALVVSLS